MSEIHTESDIVENKSGCGSIVIILLIFFALLMTVIIGSQIVQDEVWLIPGNPDSFDPIAEYQSVLAYAENDAQFVGMEAYFVQRDGTLDLNASYDPAPSVVYSFYRSTRERSDAPTGVAMSSDAIWHRQVRITISQPFQWVFATQGAAGDGIGFDVNLGMDRDRSIEILDVPATVIPAPTCSFRDFWTLAIEDSNADSDAVATIIYDASGYRFLIQGTSINLLFNAECGLTN